ncbi:MAG: hypothetical protein AAFW82_03230 [Pseudomonadota bacterium]
MTNLTTLPSMYDERVIVLAANDVHRVSLYATQIKFLEIEGDVRFRVNDNDSAPARQGIGLTAPSDVIYQSLELQDVGGVGATVRFSYTTGDITDDRSSIAGAIPVINSTAPNDRLNVTDPTLEAKIDALLLIAANIEQQQALDLRLSGITYLEAGASQTIVSSAANVNGLHIVDAYAIYAPAGRCGLYEGGRLFLGDDFTLGYNAIVETRIRNVFIGPGVDLTYDSTNGRRMHIRYRIL